MKTIIAMLAGKIEDQKLWVSDLEFAIDKFAETELDFKDDRSCERFESMRTTYVEAKAVLEDYRRGLWCIMSAEGYDLAPRDRRTPELFVK